MAIQNMFARDAQNQSFLHKTFETPLFLPEYPSRHPIEALKNNRVAFLCCSIHLSGAINFQCFFIWHAVAYVSPMEPMVKSKQSKVKVKPAHDEWTMDLFGATA
ncbi:hypothetical protein ACWKWF_13850 [Acinetobacter kookii]